MKKPGSKLILVLMLILFVPTWASQDELKILNIAPNKHIVSETPIKVTITLEGIAKGYDVTNPNQIERVIVELGQNDDSVITLKSSEVVNVTPNIIIKAEIPSGTPKGEYTINIILQTISRFKGKKEKGISIIQPEYKVVNRWEKGQIFSGGRNYSIGIIGGRNFANYACEDIDFSHAASTVVGGVVDFKVYRNIFGLVEVLHMQNRAEYSQKIPQQKEEGDFFFKIDYWQIPLMAKYSLSRENNGAYVTAGPGIGFMTQSKVDVINVEAVEKKEDHEIEDLTNDVDITLGFGVGWRHNLTDKNSFFVEGRYSYGLTDVFYPGEVTDVLSITDKRVKSRGLLVLLGYSF